MAKLIKTSLLRRPLDIILENRKILDRNSLNVFMAKSEKNSIPLEDILVAEANIPEDTLYSAIADSFSFPFTDLSDFQKPEELGSQVISLCTRLGLLPFSLIDGVLTLVTSQPARIREAESQISGIGLRSKFLVTSPTKIAPFLESFRSEHSEESDMPDINEITMSFEINSQRDGISKSVDIGETLNQPSIIQLVNQILVLGVRQGASDIHVEAIEKGARVRFRLDGVLAHRLDVPSAPASALISRIMVMASLDITERTMP
ncbi:Flp pilus assembly complex ATPase component TadA, partial [bacterium]|nr:Flp pilus assembly complex ATPase component TadA [bacterium]